MAAGAAEDGNAGLHHMVDIEGEARTVLVVKMKESEIDFFCESLTTFLSLPGLAESSLAQHTMWVAQCGIPSGDRAIWEDDGPSRILDLAIKLDGLNISNLASFELRS